MLLKFFFYFAGSIQTLALREMTNYEQFGSMPMSVILMIIAAMAEINFHLETSVNIFGLDAKSVLIFGYKSRRVK